MSKERLNACFIGHVDSGKSTTVGNLAFQLGSIDPRKMEKLKKEAEAKGKGTFSFAFVTDRNEAERDRGITITTTLMQIETAKYALNVIDCPGHKDFIKNMVTGTAQADCAVVLVPCAKGEFESAISGGTLKEHIMISGILGVPKLVFCINKVDAVPENERQARFLEVQAEMKNIAKGIHPDKDPIILPISGYHGINVIEKGEKYEWFKGWNKAGTTDKPVFTLEGAIDFQTVPPRPIDKPLRVLINDNLSVKGIGTVLTGQVIAGKLEVGMNVSVLPANVVGEIKSLEIHKVAIKECLAGENCGFVLKVTGGDVSHIKTGNVLSNAKADPVQMSYGARAKIIIVEHPRGVKVGFTPVMDIGTSHVPVRIAKFISKCAKASKVEILDPAIVSKGESCIAIIVPQKPCIMEPMKLNAQLGRLALRDSGMIVGIGAIETIYSLEELKTMGCIEDAKVEKKAAKKKK